MSRTLPSLDHVAALSDDTGMIQHAVESIPNRSTGYCTDDIARAYMVVLARLRTDPRDAHALHLAPIYLSFLHDAQLPDGRFHNFMDFDRKWLDEVGTHDSVGRAIWSLGYGVRYAPTAAWRRVSRQLLDSSLQSLDWLHYSHAEAYAMLGLAHAAAADASPGYKSALRVLAEKMAARYEATAASDWHWFEDIMTYDNARFPEAMLVAAKVLNDERFGRIGIESLAFYERVTIEDGIFVPIGNDGWYPRGGTRARFSQQPLEAAAFVDAELAAFAVTNDPGHLAMAESGLAWYYGRNIHSVTMAQGGGCFDGLDEHAVNRNMGAESTLAHLAAAYALAEHRSMVLRIAR